VSPQCPCARRPADPAATRRFARDRHRRMLLKRLRIADVAGVSALVPGYFLHPPDAGTVTRRRRDPARPHRVTAELRRVEPDPGNTRFGHVVVRPATQLPPTRLPPFGTCRNSAPLVPRRRSPDHANTDGRVGVDHRAAHWLPANQQWSFLRNAHLDQRATFCIRDRAPL
jgi:hypothetical protein